MANRNLTLDMAKVLLALMVVGLHAHLLQDTLSNLGYLLVNGVFRVAVPIFLVINGYYLYDAIQKDRFAPWLKRVAILYIFWMTVYFPFWALGGDPGIAQLVHRLVFGYHHLWYAVGIIGGGTIIYFIRALPALVGVMCSLAAFAVGVIIQYAGAYHIFQSAIDVFANHNWAHRNFLLLAFPFMYVGYFINQFTLSVRVTERFLFILTVVGLLLLLLESGFNLRHNVGVDGFDNLASLALLCPIAFLLTLRSSRVYAGKGISSISSGIYFVHPAFLYVLSPRLTSSFMQFALASVLSFVAALLLTKINNRVGFIL